MAVAATVGAVVIANIMNRETGKLNGQSIDLAYQDLMRDWSMTKPTIL